MQIPAQPTTKPQQEEEDDFDDVATIIDGDVDSESDMDDAATELQGDHTCSEIDAMNVRTTCHTVHLVPNLNALNVWRRDGKARAQLVQVLNSHDLLVFQTS